MSQSTDEDNAASIEASQYKYSVKITQTTYGARVGVHTYSDTPADAMDQAIELYHATRMGLIDRGYIIAPEDPPVKVKKV